jgi:hypothetical protein
MGNTRRPPCRFLVATALREKGGKEKELPVHHKLEELLDPYLKASGLEKEPESPLFPAALVKTGKLSRRPDQRSRSQDLQSKLPALSSSSSAPSLPAFDSIIVPPTPDTFSSDQRLLADASARGSKRSQSIDIERPVPFRRASSRRAALANAEPQAMDGLDIPNDYPDIGFLKLERANKGFYSNLISPACWNQRFLPEHHP